MTISVTSLSETIFVIGSCLITIAPRLPFDKRWSIGGKLSFPFRCLMLVLTLMNVSRTFFFSDKHFSKSQEELDQETKAETAQKWLYFIMNAAEAFGVSFLCLLTPYLIQRQLSHVTNIRPGQNLIPWLCLVGILNFLGMFLTSKYSALAFWSIKRIGDACSGVPVIKTLELYAQITTPHHGRGFVDTQIMLIVEYWTMLAVLLAAVGYMIASTPLGQTSTAGIGITEAVSLALRVSGIYSNRLRLTLHGMMLNRIDEAEELRARGGDPDGNNDVAVSPLLPDRQR